ncbi:von Willebrand factor A domain-containing protein 5A-like isoform X1 [Lates japonicus]|uniref:von Willebrand factor A domain-containing protein 5A-like isoform X1 n=1 Tax=Lates japonicus TaxID=270547 RepID=A0AAD3R4I5_LATJO|nr:von Willebrand factor A domain-containing protein 5A-like isoform X1 [Lates japonicus]
MPASSKSVKYSQKTIEEALKKVGDKALMQNEILETLNIFTASPAFPVSPDKIGKGHHSYNGLAKEGGHAQFITGTDGCNLSDAVTGFALQPAVEDISVTWDLPKVSVTALSPPITALSGSRSFGYAQLTGQNQHHFSLKPEEDTGLTVHRLGAWTLIRSLEMEETDYDGQHDEGVKKKLVELSVQSGVSSSYTAFIAVNKGNNKPIQGPLVCRDVPTAYCLKGYCMDLYDDDPCNNFNVFREIGASLGLSSLTSHGKSVKKKVKSVFNRIGSYLKGQSASPQSNKASLSRDPNTEPKQPLRDPLLQLVSLQEASGRWVLDSTLAAALGKTSEEVEKTKPALVKQEVWATILALIWLHGFKMDAKEEWELLAKKAVSWLRALNAPCVAECVEAGNTLLGCEVQRDVLGL